jgi:hypothetical protein
MYKELLEGNVEDSKVVADQVWRTTNSGNSELLGMVHETNAGKCPFQLPERQKSVVLPQFNVRRVKQIEIQLELNAGPTTLIQVPVYNQMGANEWVNPFNWGGCPNQGKIVDKRSN